MTFTTCMEITSLPAFSQEYLFHFLNVSQSFSLIIRTHFVL